MQKQLKNGQMMASLVLEDTSSSVQAVCFSAILLKYRHLMNVGNALKVTAKISQRDENAKELIIEAIEQLPAFASNFTAPVKKTKTLYLKVKSIDSPEMSKVKEILSVNKGETPVYIYDAYANKKYCAPEHLWADIHNDLIGDLSDILGTDNVKIVEK